MDRLYGTKGTLVVDKNKVLVYKERRAVELTNVYEAEPYRNTGITQLRNSFII